jgi:hypothetical protein
MGGGSSSSLADFVCVLVGVFSATAISIIICIISAVTTSELDTESRDVELDEFHSLGSTDRDSDRLPLCD